MIEFCTQCGHPWDPHRLLGYGDPPTEGWMECPVSGCTCSRTWSLERSNNPAIPPTLELFRPVGQKELDLIAASGYRRFPPRLPEQPIFYPVLNEGYAVQIARDWNARSNTERVGYVTRFQVRASYASKFPVQVVGGRNHQELWVPAEELEEFNSNIVGVIEVIGEYRSHGGAA